MHGIALEWLVEPECEASPRTPAAAAPQSYRFPALVFDGRIWYRLAQALSYPCLRALRCLSKAHAYRISSAQSRSATHIIGGRMALVWEFYCEFFIQLAPPLLCDPLTRLRPHCAVEFLS